MDHSVSKSNFQEKAPELLHEVESTGQELIITDHGNPVLKLVPYASEPEKTLRSLLGSVVRYDGPLEPVDQEAWESLR
jgi:prevent-host-death family protein